MNFSEFKRLLGAEPRSEDPAFLRARESSAEFAAEAEKALAFEDRLDRAVSVPMPAGLEDSIASIAQTDPTAASAPVVSRQRRWVPLALAASVLVAIGAVTLTWQSRTQWDSVDEYLVDHYRHDGHQLLARLGEVPGDEVQAILADVGAQATAPLANIVGVIKYCPTPDGKGVHMVLNTETGPVTLIYMPETEVIDQNRIQIDDIEAVLVSLPRGSAAILGAGLQQEQALYALVHDSLQSLPEQS